MPTTAFNRAGERHYKTTGPLGFIEGFDLDVKRFEWSVKSGNTFKLRLVNDTDRDGPIESTEGVGIQ